MIDKQLFDEAVLTNREVFATQLQHGRGYDDKSPEDFDRLIRSALNGDLTHDRKTFIEVAALASIAASQQHTEE